MSLISVRNFLSPFRSKVQIGALLVLAFLAFVVRYGYNGPENRASEPNLRVATEESRRSSSSLTDLMADQEAQLNGAKRKPVAGDARLDDLMAGGGTQREQPEQDSDSTKPKKLGDIARDLGLE